MWAGLGRFTRAVLTVAWVVLVVGFGPSAAWAGGDSASATSAPVPTSSDGAASSSSPPSQTAPGDTSSSTSEPPPPSEPSPTDAGPVLVELEPGQWDQLLQAIDAPAPVDTGASGVVVLDPGQWDTVTDHLSAVTVAAALLVLVGFAGTVAGWGRSA